MTFKMNFNKIFILLFINFFVFNLSHAQDPQAGWDFTYPETVPSEKPMLDLSYLNEDVAGENGFIRLSKDGNSFVNGKGEPVRFWSVNGGGLAKNFSDEEMKEFAQFLAKMGVNMIRFHGSINPAGKGTEITDVDKEDVDAIWKMVGYMKEEGIYSTISPFWAHNGHMGGWVPEEWGIDGYSGKDALWGVMFFNDRLKNAYKTWVKYLYTEKNPYTGIALKDDPAVGIIQVKNEDGLFFWTIQGVKESLKKVIRKDFHDWLADKYGSISKAQEQWGMVELDGDNPQEGKMDIYDIWMAAQDQSGGVDKRLSDQMEFMAEVQRNFYQDIYDHYRSMGCRQLINGNNWKTADAARLLDIERWTNSVCDVIALNRYNDPGHAGENSGWRIDPGHHYQGKSVLYHPNKLPINVKQPEGYPVVITESGWNLPHKYQAEGPFLISAYMSLTGVDSYYWFSPTAVNYDKSPYRTWDRLPGGMHPMNRWTMSVPGQLGMFPANALLFRKGMLKTGDKTVEEKRTLQSMWNRAVPAITENMGFDPNRDTRSATAEDTQISPLAFLTGKVVVDYAAKKDKVKTNKLDRLISFSESTVTSSTGELFWDYGKGICMMDAPAAQGICGFVGKVQNFELSDVSIKTTNDYATVNVVALDDKPVSKSSELLVQVGTVYRPTDWKDTATEYDMRGEKVSGYRIDNTGKMPWKAANTLVTLNIANSNIKRAVVLDAAGYPKSTIDVQRSGKNAIIELPEDAMYVILDGGSE